MRLKTLVATVLLGTLMGCGGSGVGPRSGNGALTESDGGAPGEDGGTDAGIVSGMDGGTSSADGGTEACDCTGLALPDVCMVCSDGMSACAHFVCAQGTCEVQICQ